MSKKPLKRRVSEASRRFRESWGMDISSPQARRRAWWDFQLMDHAFLRRWWTNSRQIADGVYRANQPSSHRIARYARSGIRTILNLRGDRPQSHYLFEREACEANGITLVDRRLHATKLPDRETLLDLFETFRMIEKPFVMHCKSGADRSGFAAALYLLAMTDTPVAEARRQLHWRHLHFKTEATGILDFFLDTYGKARAESGVSLQDWVRAEFDDEVVTAAYRKAKGLE